MAKTRTVCEICGGITDGTPSGKKRHDASNVHRTASAVKIAEAVVAGAPEREARVAAFRNGKPTPEDKDEVATPEGQAALAEAADAAKVARNAARAIETPVGEVLTAQGLAVATAESVGFPDSIEAQVVRAELKKRLSDLKWRQDRQIGMPGAKGSKMAGQQYSAEQVEAYRVKKVVPLETRLAELSKG